MPTTLVGLVLFLGLVSPGLTYLAVSERGRSSIRDLTAFRELATVALTSVLFNAVAFLLFSLARLGFPSQTPDVGKLIADPKKYFVEHYGVCFTWSALIFATAVGAAAVAAGLLSRPNVVKGVEDWRVVRFFRPDKVRFISAWTKVFEDKHPERFKFVTLRLQDGTCLRGYLLSFNPDSNETADRSVALSAPVDVRTDNQVRIVQYGVMLVDNRNILAMHVDYLDDTEESPAEWAL